MLTNKQYEEAYRELYLLLRYEEYENMTLEERKQSVEELSKKLGFK